MVISYFHCYYCWSIPKMLFVLKLVYEETRGICNESENYMALNLNKTESPNSSKQVQQLVLRLCLYCLGCCISLFCEL